MKAIDIHSHLSSSDYADDRSAMIERALDVCDYVIDIGSGTSPRAFADARALAETYPAIYFTAGIHPHDAATLGADGNLRHEIASALQHKKCVAVGECGLDYYHEQSPKKEQAEVFQWQARLAIENKLPLMIHTRDAEEDTKSMLRNFSGRGVFHCFTGSYDLASFGIDRGFLISFSGIVTFKNADDLRKTFLALPLEAIVVETDAPYLAPVPQRGKRNESSFIVHTAQFLADLRKMPLEDFLAKTSENAVSLFDKMSHP